MPQPGVSFSLVGRGDIRSTIRRRNEAADDMAARSGRHRMDLTRYRMLEAYRRMRTIRALEEKLNELVTAGKLASTLRKVARNKKLPD